MTTPQPNSGIRDNHNRGSFADFLKATMNPYYNLPPEQHRTQQLADQFNTDEQLWEKLEPKRKLRRKLLRGLPKKKLKKIDLLEFATARPPLDCIGTPLTR